MTEQSATTNRQWRVKRYPATDEPVSNDLFDWVESPLPEPDDGEFLVRTLYLAPGPAMRGYLEPGHAGFFSTVPVGEVMRGRGIGEVVSSNHPDYQPGDIFVGSLGWQDYSVQTPRGKEFVFSTKKVEEPPEPLSLELGMLGQAGVTAYISLTEGGNIKAGDTVLISAAAGGVGSAAGQIAKALGAKRVVGLSSSTEKCAWLVDNLGLDAALNYRNDDFDAQLEQQFPDGIDVYLDSVGGEVLNTVLAHLAMHGRVAVCGFISTDYDPAAAAGPINYRHLLYKRGRMQGTVVFDHWERFGDIEAQLRAWHQSGDIKLCEDVTEGLVNMPQAVEDLFCGNNLGLKICKVGSDPKV